MPAESGEPISELDALREGLLRILEDVLIGEFPRRRTALLHGAFGSGKTRLAARFASRHSDRFPGGTPILGSRLDGDLEAVLGHMQPDKRALLVIDDADRASLSDLRKLFDRIGEERPLASVLMTSRTLLRASPEMVVLEMPPLRNEEVVALLAQQLNLPPRQLQRLGDLLAGNSAAFEEASRRLLSGMPLKQVVQWFESGSLPVARDSEGHVLLEGSPERSRLDVTVSEISEALIEELAKKPDLLYELDPRKFEHLIAELYRRRGFEAMLTPASGDEGVDIYVVSRNDLGRTLWVVQAKRNAADNRVEAGVVRELYGTVMAKDASAGILVTTSFFQPGAVKLEREFEYRLSLKDYIALQEMLRWPRA